MSNNSKICKKCKKEVNIDLFQDKTKNKEYGSCFNCREQSRLWREKNKERVSKYNKYTNIKNKVGKKIDVVYGRKKGTEDWIKYKSQADAAEKLNLCKPNINKVIKGSLNTTGGYEFKVQSENNNIVLKKDWETIKEENNYSNEPLISPNRIEHEIVDNITGKICCTCKVWKPLTKFNKSNSHWDKLRNECVECLTIYRKKLRAKNKDNKHIRNLENLRAKLSSILKKIKDNKKSNKINKILGCTVTELKEHIENQFTDEMTWENHGDYWHLDHIVPCNAFDLSKPIEQFVCFNYKNLQPLKCEDNFSKGNKYEVKDKKELYKKVIEIDV